MDLLKKNCYSSIGVIFFFCITCLINLYNKLNLTAKFYEYEPHIYSVLFGSKEFFGIAVMIQ